MTITFDQVKELLNLCTRFESRDHTFGDREVYWEYDGEEVAEGYFSREGSSVSLRIPEELTFHGEHARELVKCGAIVNIGRNDETGPDEYRGA